MHRMGQMQGPQCRGRRIQIATVPDSAEISVEIDRNSRFCVHRVSTQSSGPRVSWLFGFIVERGKIEGYCPGPPLRRKPRLSLRFWKSILAISKRQAAVPRFPQLELQ